MPKQIFKKGKRYTFSDYFDMGNPTQEIISALGYAFATQTLTLPRETTEKEKIDTPLIADLRDAYYTLIPKISINSEIAKRELMIAPILHAVMRSVDARLDVEYPVDVDEKLSGLIDYFFRAKKELIVIEAKKGDLEKGFNQLAAEMIAIDKYEEDTVPSLLYGAISIGEVWRFAVLERNNKKLIKDIHTFRFPEDLEDIFSILKGILQ